jgi:hypothetical protein
MRDAIFQIQDDQTRPRGFKIVRCSESHGGRHLQLTLRSPFSARDAAQAFLVKLEQLAACAVQKWMKLLFGCRAIVKTTLFSMNLGPQALGLKEKASASHNLRRAVTKRIFQYSREPPKRRFRACRTVYRPSALSLRGRSASPLLMAYL